MEPVLEILQSVFWVLVAIMILVFVHEMGHFLFAKLFKMRVDRFSIGFPPKIFSKKVGETEYMLGATPLGGYVKIAGMVDESMDTEFAGREPEPWEFRAKPVWQRIIVITAGVAFNMLLAAVIFIGLKYAYGETQPLATEDHAVYVADSSLAYQMGVRTGDRILAIGGKPFQPYDDLGNMVALLADSLTVTVERAGDTLTIVGPDDIITQLNRAGGSLGMSFIPTVIGDVMPGTPAEELGLTRGDRIVAVDGVPVKFWEEMSARIQASEGEAIEVTWVRPDTSGLVEADAQGVSSVALATGGRVFERRVAPEKDPASGRYILGVRFALHEQEYGFGEAVVAGIKDTWINTRSTVISLKRMVTGRENFRENIGGPVMVAMVTKQAAEAGARAFWSIVALLSITLAIVNILPIPALDGGHLVFLLYEGITRREPSLRVRMAMQQIGMLLLVTLMVFLIFNDILRL